MPDVVGGTTAAESDAQDRGRLRAWIQRMSS